MAHPLGWCVLCSRMHMTTYDVEEAEIQDGTYVPHGASGGTTPIPTDAERIRDLENWSDRLGAERDAEAMAADLLGVIAWVAEGEWAAWIDVAKEYRTRAEQLEKREYLGKPPDWKGCSLPADHEGGHRDDTYWQTRAERLERAAREMVADVDSAYGLMSKRNYKIEAALKAMKEVLDDH